MCKINKAVIRMRKIYKYRIIVIFLVLVFIGLYYLKTNKFKEIKSEYLIDIWIENRQGIDIDFIQLGVVYNENEEKIINMIDKEYVEKENMHLTINYSPETQFFLRGSSGEKNIKACYFNLKEYTNTQEEQRIDFYVDNYEIYQN